MNETRIDTGRCTRCGRCARVCPLGIFEGGADAPARRREKAAGRCIACGHCAAACPAGAITLNNVRPEALEPADTPLPSFDDVRRLVRRRRSVRLYQQRLVPREEIGRLLEAVRWAPTACNSQGVRWIVVHRPERVREVAGQVIEHCRARNELPELVSAWEHGYDMVLRGAPHLVAAHGPADSPWAATDCVIALTTFELLARAAGLGTCWAGFLVMAAAARPAIAAGLGVPADHRLHGALMLGYPLAAFLRVPPRNEAKVQWVE
jgi:nitroreductase/NAD-dependent dihydropyrimidine dehydrogenase PreA subunit